MKSCLQGYGKCYLNFFGECGTKHQRLTFTSLRHGVLVNNAAYLRLKSHVQHAVSLIQDKEPNKIDSCIFLSKSFFKVIPLKLFYYQTFFKLGVVNNHDMNIIKMQ